MRKLSTNQIILGYIAISFLIMSVSLFAYSLLLFCGGAEVVVTIIFFIIMRIRSGTMDA